MQRKAMAMVAMLATCFSAFASGQGRSMRSPSDEREFQDAVRYSYKGKHPEAEQRFADYQQKYPDDLLVPLRRFEDLYFGVYASKPNDKQYHELLAMLNGAIGIFEREQCSGTDLQGIGKGTLDCGYVGTALYGDRMALTMKRHPVWNIIGAIQDNGRLKAAAATSKPELPQTTFLLGVHEYELGIHGRGDPEAGIRKIVAASVSDTSPFADDIQLFLLGIPQGSKEMEIFFNQHPREDILRRLRSEYPQNKALLDDQVQKSKTEFEKTD